MQKHNKIFSFLKIWAISRSITSTTAMFIVCRFSDVLTSEESVRFDVIFVVASVTTSVTLCSVAHTASDPVLVFTATFLTVAEKFTDEYPFLLPHRHCVDPFFAAFANGFLRSGVPDVTVARA